MGFKKWLNIIFKYLEDVETDFRKKWNTLYLHSCLSNGRYYKLWSSVRYGVHNQKYMLVFVSSFFCFPSLGYFKMKKKRVADDVGPSMNCAVGLLVKWRRESTVDWSSESESCVSIRYNWLTSAPLGTKGCPNGVIDLCGLTV